MNRTVQAEEAPGGSSRLEPLQLALALSDCLVRILRPIVAAIEPVGPREARNTITSATVRHGFPMARLGTAQEACARVVGLPGANSPPY